LVRGDLFPVPRGFRLQRPRPDLQAGANLARQRGFPWSNRTLRGTCSPSSPTSGSRKRSLPPRHSRAPSRPPVRRWRPLSGKRRLRSPASLCWETASRSEYGTGWNASPTGRTF